MTDALSHRQRKQAFMSSSIFDEGGPRPDSVCKPARQKEIIENLPAKRQFNANERLATQPAGVMKQQQNQGNQAVLPMQHATPTTAKKDREAIPREFWNCDVNVKWTDVRNELCTKDPRPADAKGKKALELSSGVFGSDRATAQVSGPAPPALQSTTRSFLGEDSSSLKKDAALPPKHAFKENLANSKDNTFAVSPPRPEAAPVPFHDDSNMDRRRREKNFSNLFGTEMAEPAKVNRGNINQTANSDWRHTASGIESRRPATETLQERKERELGSNLPFQPSATGGGHKLEASERACYDTASPLTADAEIMRRRRERNSTGRPATAEQRMHAEMSSVGVVDGAPVGQGKKKSTERGCWDTSRLMDTMSEVARRQRDRGANRPLTAKERKQAELGCS